MTEHGPDAVRREWEALDDTGWILTPYELRIAMRGCTACAAVIDRGRRQSRIRSAYRARRGRGW